MKLLTAAILKKLPNLYGTEGTPLKDKLAVLKFFNPCGAATWWIVEGSKEEYEDGTSDFIMWGYADLGLGEGCAEFGYVTLSELEAIRLPFGLRIERDINWSPTRLGDIPQIKIY